MEDIIIIIVLYMIGSMLSDQIKRDKRRKKPKNTREKMPDVKIPSRDRDNPFGFEIPPIKTENAPDFEIPKIEGAPKRKPEFDSEGIYREEEPKVSNKYLDYLNSNDKKSEPKKEPEESTPKITIPTKEPKVLTKETLRSGVILAEILNKPRAYRRIR